MIAPTLPPSQSCTQESVRNRKGKLFPHCGQEQHSSDCLRDSSNLLQDFSQNRTEVACHQICTSVLESGAPDFLSISYFSRPRHIAISIPSTLHMVIHSCSWQSYTQQLHLSIFSRETTEGFTPLGRSVDSSYGIEILGLEIFRAQQKPLTSA